MRELKKQCPEREIHLGQRQVDVYAGLNVMILLLELHRYGQFQSNEDIKQQLIFHPCGKLNADNYHLEDSKLLLRVIDQSQCIRFSGFRDIVGNFLSGANLYGSDINGSDLNGADLLGANLSGGNFNSIRWDKSTNWDGVVGLDRAINVPKDLIRHLAQ